jgi:hypothetical protein
MNLAPIGAETPCRLHILTYCDLPWDDACLAFYEI